MPVTQPPTGSAKRIRCETQRGDKQQIGETRKTDNASWPRSASPHFSSSSARQKDDRTGHTLNTYVVVSIVVILTSMIMIVWQASPKERKSQLTRRDEEGKERETDSKGKRQRAPTYFEDISCGFCCCYS